MQINFIVFIFFCIVCLAILIVFFGFKSEKPITIKQISEDSDRNLKNKDIIFKNECVGESNFLKVKVKHVIDGDTVIVVKNGAEVKIRLDSIDCPEDGQEWGDTAKFGLIKLIGGRFVYIEEHTIDCYGRIVATIYVDGENKLVNVNERMIALGHAWVMRRFYNHLSRERQKKLNQLEYFAKNKKVGLWKMPNPIPPWEWRKQDAGCVT